MFVKAETIASELCKVWADTIKITVSSPVKADEEFVKQIIKPIEIKGEKFYQAERFKNNKAYHANITANDFSVYIKDLFSRYTQINAFLAGRTLTYYVNPKGNIAVKESKNNLTAATSKTNDRQKEYILKEGENIPALVDLGVFTKEYKVVKSMYDKYKQINRFVELIDDELSNEKNEEITVLDFGCGKSYLTFIVYYYLVKIKGKKAKIIGYDLKEDVVESCNAIAKKYGYDGLTFVVSDVKKDKLYDEKIDVVISLHACDVATDYALYYAIKKNVKHVFSVPCCQHEINSRIRTGNGDLDCLLKYGIVKERVSALLTDSIRAMILEDAGYKVDVIEFVDLAHSPKNLMLRAKKTRIPIERNKNKIAEICLKYHFRQTLFDLYYSQSE